MRGRLTPPASAAGHGGLARAAFAAGALLAVAALQVAWMDPWLGLYDESIVLVGADRVRHGDLVFRDFWSLYGPATYRATAIAFELLGDTAFAGRLLDVAVKTAIVGLAWWLARRLGAGRTVAALAGAAVLATLVGVRGYGAPMHAATAWALAALACADRAVAAPRARAGWAAACGAALGVAILYRQDLGVYGAVACAVFFGASRMDGRRASATAAAVAAAAAAAVVLPAVAFYAWQVPWPELAYALVEVPLRVYPVERALPFPSLALGGVDGAGNRIGRGAALAVRLPFVAIAVAVAVEAVRARRRGPGVADPARPLRLAVLALAVLFTAKGWIRVQPLHMAPALVACAVLAAGWFAGASPFVAAPRVAAALAALGALALAGLGGLAVVRGGLDGRWFAQAAALCADRSVPRLRCLALDPDRTAVARRLLADGSRGRPIYVGAGRHDKLFLADLALLYVSEGRSATRWHDLHPGVQTTEAVQRAMLAEFRAAPPERIVLDRRADDEAEPNGSARASGVTLLDGWIRAHWREDFRAGDVSILVPRERPRGGPDR